MPPTKAIEARDVTRCTNQNLADNPQYLLSAVATIVNGYFSDIGLPPGGKRRVMSAAWDMAEGLGVKSEPTNCNVPSHTNILRTKAYVPRPTYESPPEMAALPRNSAWTPSGRSGKTPQSQRRRVLAMGGIKITPVPSLKRTTKPDDENAPNTWSGTEKRTAEKKEKKDSAKKRKLQNLDLEDLGEFANASSPEEEESSSSSGSDDDDSEDNDFDGKDPPNHSEGRHLTKRKV